MGTVLETERAGRNCGRGAHGAHALRELDARVYARPAMAVSAAGTPASAERASVSETGGAFSLPTGYMSIFVIGQVVSLAVAQRRRESVLLRAVGAGPRQIRRMVATEALWEALSALPVGYGIGSLPARACGPAPAWPGPLGPVVKALVAWGLAYMGGVVVSGAVHDWPVSSSRRWESTVPITNQQVAGHAFLRQMYDDSYFPDRVVDQGKAILVRLCGRIEAEQPSDLGTLYALTQAATEEFNLLDREFVAAGSGIETVAREWICDEFCFVASAYGFTDAVGEVLTAGRDW